MKRGDFFVFELALGLARASSTNGACKNAFKVFREFRYECGIHKSISSSVVLAFWMTGVFIWITRIFFICWMLRIFVIKISLEAYFRPSNIL
jgi:hypothetical protein